MLGLSVRDNVRQVLSFTDRLSSQYEFAVASALTNTVKAVRDAMPAEAERALDRPTRFTKGAFFFTRAEKRRLVAVVGVKDLQARYLKFQVYGGSRAPTRKALKLPGEIQLDSSGNIPRQALKRLIAEAKRGRGKARSPGGKSNYKGKADGLFYGKPANQPDLPAGIYRRVGSVRGQGGLEPVVLFPQQPASYKPLFHFHRIAQRIAQRTFEPELRRAWARARATAR